jgi:hypothetical protein
MMATRAGASCCQQRASRSILVIGDKPPLLNHRAARPDCAKDAPRFKVSPAVCRADPGGSGAVGRHGLAAVHRQRGAVHGGRRLAVQRGLARRAAGRLGAQRQVQDFVSPRWPFGRWLEACTAACCCSDRRQRRQAAPSIGGCVSCERVRTVWWPACVTCMIWPRVAFHMHTMVWHAWHACEKRLHATSWPSASLSAVPARRSGHVWEPSGCRPANDSRPQDAADGTTCCCLSAQAHQRGAGGAGAGRQRGAPRGAVPLRQVRLSPTPSRRDYQTLASVRLPGTPRTCQLFTSSVRRTLHSLRVVVSASTKLVVRRKRLVPRHCGCRAQGGAHLLPEDGAGAPVGRLHSEPHTLRGCSELVGSGGFLLDPSQWDTSPIDICMSHFNSTAGASAQQW